MTVKELKELLDKFPDGFIVMVPEYDTEGFVPVVSVIRGVNEADRCVFIGGADD